MIKRLALVLLVTLSACVPVMRVGSSGLNVSDLQFQSDHRDQSGRSYICDNKISTVSFGFAYSDFNKLASWEAQLVGLTSATRLPKLVQTRDGGGYRVVDGHVKVDWVLSAGVAPLSIVVRPVVEPHVIGTTSLELTIRATDGSSATVQFSGIPVVDNCP